MRGIGRIALALIAVFAANGALRAQPETTGDVRTLLDAQERQIQSQQQQIEELRQRLQVLNVRLDEKPPEKPANPPVRAEDKSTTKPEPIPGGVAPQQPAGVDPKISEAIAAFLKDNPGAGMPPGVQTGFEAGGGFFIRSPPNPPYVQWDDQSRIPFELRIRGRAQIDYYFYKVTDNLNHLTGRRYEPEVGDFSQIEAKRVRLIFEGNLFDPNLRYQLQIDGNTRGLGGTQNNRIVQTNGTPPGAVGAPGIGGATDTIGGGDSVDNAVRLFTAWVAYDIPLGGSKGCGCDCPDGTYRYTPMLTFIIGKQQPFFGFTEILGSANAQLVDFAMADWFFDADDNNMQTAAAVQLRADDDRLFATMLITNGNESQFPNTQMDRLPGFQGGFWYDAGGTWNEQRKRYDLYGPSLSDLDYSLNPVVRFGGAYNLVPMDRRSIYGDLEQSRVFVAPGGPGGTRLINLLNGDSGTPLGSHAVDKFDSYSFDVFASAHYRGFSLTNEWWFRSLNNFQTTRNGGNQIVYQDGSGANALFPTGHGLFDYGTLIQSGYFLVPKKLEVVGRYSMIRGDSGDVNGTGKFRTTTVSGFTNPVRVIDGAFRNFHEASEIAFGFNYFFYGQLVKWSSDFSVYQGGNPAGGGASPTGYIAGVDGWLVRTQIQVAF